MAISLGDAVVTFRADLTDLNKQVGNATRQMKKDFGNLMQIGQQVGRAFTIMGGAIVGGLAFAVKEASAAEDAAAQLDAVLKSTGGAAGVTADEIKKLAAELQKTTTFGDDATVAASALLLTFTQIGKDVFPDAIKASQDMSIAMGQDLQQTIIQVGKALNDPIQGVTALRRVGVQLTDQQEEQIRAFMESNNVMAAQRVVLDELSRQFGGSAAAAANTLSGQLTQLKNDFGDLLEDIGNALTDGGGIRGLIGMIREAVNATRAWIQEHPQLTGWIVKIAAVVGGLMVVLGPLLIMLPGLVAAFAAAGPVVAALGTVLAAVISPIGLIVAGIAALIAGAIALYYNWDRVVGWLADLWERMKQTASNVLQAMGAGIATAMQNIVWAFTHPWDAVKAAWEAVKNFFREWFNTITGWFKTAWDWISGIIKAIGKAIKWVGGEVSTGFSEAGGAVPQFASGGVMPYTGMALVGEKGPELVRLPAGSRVFNARESEDMVARTGQQINMGGVNITVSGALDPAAVVREISTRLESAIQNKLAKRGLRLRTA